jgi:hypothetical protein
MVLRISELETHLLAPTDALWSSQQGSDSTGQYFNRNPLRPGLYRLLRLIEDSWLHVLTKFNLECIVVHDS